MLVRKKYAASSMAPGKAHCSTASAKDLVLLTCISETSRCISDIIAGAARTAFLEVSSLTEPRRCGRKRTFKDRESLRLPNIVCDAYQQVLLKGRIIMSTTPLPQPVRPNQATLYNGITYGIAGFLTLAACAGVYYWMFSRFSPWDDDGYLLIGRLSLL